MKESGDGKRKRLQMFPGPGGIHVFVGVNQGLVVLQTQNSQIFHQKNEKNDDEGVEETPRQVDEVVGPENEPFWNFHQAPSEFSAKIISEKEDPLHDNPEEKNRLEKKQKEKKSVFQFVTFSKGPTEGHFFGK
jgi:hypothetical protein